MLGSVVENVFFKDKNNNNFAILSPVKNVKGMNSKKIRTYFACRKKAITRLL